VSKVTRHHAIQTTQPDATARSARDPSQLVCGPAAVVDRRRPVRRLRVLVRQAHAADLRGGGGLRGGEPGAVHGDGVRGDRVGLGRLAGVPAAAVLQRRRGRLPVLPAAAAARRARGAQRPSAGAGGRGAAGGGPRDAARDRAGAAQQQRRRVQGARRRRRLRRVVVHPHAADAELRALRAGDHGDRHRADGRLDAQPARYPAARAARRAMDKIADADGDGDDSWQ